MKSLVIVALFALCAIAFADSVPEALLPCSFRLTVDFDVNNEDGETVTTARNEMIRDNGDFWLWRCKFDGLDPIVEKRTWEIIWRPDNNTVYRNDLEAKHCYKMSFEQQPLPYDWIMSKTYGVLWFDELVDYDGKEATMYTAVGVGSYYGMDFETSVNFFVTNEDQQIVSINGSLQAPKEGIKLFVVTKSLSYDHNMPVDASTFVISAPCNPAVPAPDEPSADFKAKCYGTGAASVITLSWIAVIVAMLAALLNF